MAVPATPPPGAMTTAKGGLSSTGYRFLDALRNALSTTQNTVSTASATKAQGSQPEAVFIETPAAKSYLIWVNVPRGRTIESITTRCAAGTCTLTGAINGTALGATANSVSTTEQEQAASSANVMAAGDDFVLTLSSVSSCTDLSIMIKFSETLD